MSVEQGNILALFGYSSVKYKLTYYNYQEWSDNDED